MLQSTQSSYNSVEVATITPSVTFMTSHDLLWFYLFRDVILGRVKPSPGEAASWELRGLDAGGDSFDD